ncbi:MAG: DUF2147 domain-containing protein [Bacteroidales bacterium]|nr:DUF2147 domain-containing protein [Bacteroidales bacterium]
MKKTITLISFILITLCATAQEALVGRWTTIDDKTGEARSVVRIYKATDGLYYGKIEVLYVPEKYQNVVCEKCKGNDKDKPILGMVILRGMKADGNTLFGGSLLDPESGNFYHGKISLEKDGRLKLRGSIDKAGLLGRTQYWKRAQ